MKNLYTYFGLIDINNIDSPGHFLYQLGLIDSIKETFHRDTDNFDFYSYYPEHVIESAEIKEFPTTERGQLFTKYKNELIANTYYDINIIIQKIRNKEYENLYLKARFRNLSTLSKKWKDAFEFELIIDEAVAAGYLPHQIIILDTDLSLSDSFYDKYQFITTVIIPSIHFPGISSRFLDDCMMINMSSSTTIYKPISLFYGNIDTSNYKSGNSKSSILSDSLNWVNDITNMNEIPFYLICKPKEFQQFDRLHTYCILRNDRENIWNTLEISSIMLNITKEKYNDRQFIPARIFEAMIFGLVPVSYKFNWLCPAFSFNSLDDLSEIYKYLFECDEAGLKQAYKYFVDSYLNYCSSIKTLTVAPI
jgi:hypothetical protein